MPTKIYRDFCPGSVLEGRAEIIVIFGWHFGRTDDLINKFILNLTDLQGHLGMLIEKANVHECIHHRMSDIIWMPPRPNQPICLKLVVWENKRNGAY